LNDRSPQNAYSTSSLLNVDVSDYSTEQIVNVLKEYSILLSLVSEDKELLQRFKRALSRPESGPTPEVSTKDVSSTENI
jgi:hypothetical protein